jgi:LysM repeat protein
MASAMKTVSLLSAVLLFPAISLVAKEKSEIEILKARVDVQERKISQLEKALNRLTGTTSHAPVVAKRTIEKKAVFVASEGEYVVVKGDTLSRIARRHHTTVAAIKKVNALKSDGLHIGQKLKLPKVSASSAMTHVAKKDPAPLKTSHQSAVKNEKGKHTVKAGETFYGIARRYGMSEATLQAANPKAKPTRLQIGQVLVIDASAKPASVVKKSPSSLSAVKSPRVKKSPVVKAPVKKVPEKKSAVAKTSKPSAPVPPTPKKPSSIRTITVQEQMTYGAFASKHGASTSQLNSLNGLNLNKSTMLAKGSELYVPQY